MIEDIGKDIISQIEIKLSDIYGRKIKGFGVGHKDVDGKIVVGQVEKNYIGITDNIGSFFYIRYTAQNVVRVALSGLESVGACASNIFSFPLRIVLINDMCNDYESVSNALISAVNSIKINKQYPSGAISPRVAIKTFNMSSFDVFAEETGLDKSQFLSSAIHVCSLDFDLKFKQKNNYCKQIKLC